MTEMVNHPKHYNSNPSGIECIDVVEHMNFCLGSAMKYIWRADSKGNAIEDLKKAAWYLSREIANREGAARGTAFLQEHDFRMDREFMDGSHSDGVL